MQKAMSTNLGWPMADCLSLQVFEVLTAGSKVLYSAAKGLSLFGGSVTLVHDCLKAFDRMFMRRWNMLCAGDGCCRRSGVVVRCWTCFASCRSKCHAQSMLKCMTACSIRHLPSGILLDNILLS